MRCILIAAFLALPAIVWAEDWRPGDIAHYYVMMVDFDKSMHKSFTMDLGACLRGPLKFYDVDEKVVFELGMGTDFPTGCSH